MSIESRRTFLFNRGPSITIGLGLAVAGVTGVVLYEDQKKKDPDTDPANFRGIAEPSSEIKTRVLEEADSFLKEHARAKFPLAENSSHSIILNRVPNLPPRLGMKANFVWEVRPQGLDKDRYLPAVVYWKKRDDKAESEGIMVNVDRNGAIIEEALRDNNSGDMRVDEMDAVLKKVLRDTTATRGKFVPGETDETGKPYYIMRGYAPVDGRGPVLIAAIFNDSRVFIQTLRSW